METFIQVVYKKCAKCGAKFTGQMPQDGFPGGPGGGGILQTSHSLCSQCELQELLQRELTEQKTSGNEVSPKVVAIMGERCMDTVGKAVNLILNMIKYDFVPYEILPQGAGHEVPGNIIFTYETALALEEFEITPNYVAESEEGEEILGSYYPMESPGRIVIYWEKIGQLFWYIVDDFRRQGHYIDKDILYQMCRVTVLKTYLHEQFHHGCDVIRQLLEQKRHSRNEEEALAVAWSRQELENFRDDKRKNMGIVQFPLYRELLDRLYCYYAPGYRDWVRYRTAYDMEKGLVSFFNSRGIKFLEGCDVNVGDAMINLIDKVKNQGVIEILVP